MPQAQDYQAPADLLKDKTILVTGAGAGIGRAAALAYAAHGATVILLGRTTHKLEDVYDEIVAAGGPKPAIYPMNFEGASPKDFDDLASTLEKEFGALHGLLHNAAWLGSTTPIEGYDAELWYKVMQINVNAPFMLTQALMPLMRKTENASMIFTLDDKTTAYWGAYGVAKHALEGLMMIVADEMDTDQPIKVSAINPCPVKTNIRLNAFPGEDPNTLKMPEEIMATYLYLMGEDSNGHQGEIFKIERD